MKHLIAILLTATPLVAAQSPARESPRLAQGARRVQVCILGNVGKPAIVATEGPITLLQAIKQAGGALPDTKSSGASVYRRQADTDGEIILIDDLRKVEKEAGLGHNPASSRCGYGVFA
jgi:hypothetical protein